MLTYKRIISFALALLLTAEMLPLQILAAQTEETLPAETAAATEAAWTEETKAAEPAQETTLPEQTAGAETVEQTAAAETAAQPTEPEEEIFAEVSEVVAPDADLPESADLYDGYLTRLFYGSSIAFFGTNARERLTEAEKHFYDVLKAEILKIAAGERTSARVEIKKDTMQQWGMAVSFDTTGAADTNAKVSIAKEGFFAQINQRNIIQALMYDCPYEMYWYDKTVGTKITSGYSIKGNQTSVTRVTFNFRVVGDMQPSGYDADNPAIDTSFVSTAKAAAARAQSIVESCEGLDDYKKLTAYKDAICDLTSYNTTAASSTVYTTDADPWQLIYVFDGDSSTTVVCEGYSKAFQYLFDLSTFRSDVSSILVVGTLSGGGHMWNVVRIGGQNYIADVTNSDSGTAGQNGGLFLAGGSGSVSGGYRFLGHLFAYTDTTIELWGEENLALADSDYSPYLASGSCGEGLSWTVDHSGTLEIVGSGAMDVYESEEAVPWYPVRSQISSLLLPSGITRIAPYAFSGCAIGEVTIPAGVAAIGTNAFANCENLKRIDFLGDAPAVESGAFAGTGAAAYYSAVNPTWTEEVLAGFDSDVSWTATCYGGHTEVIDEALAPTCTETGLTKGRHCSVCAMVFEPQTEIPALGHTEIIDQAVAPDCTNTGLTEGRHCDVCGEVLLAQEILDALGHTEAIDEALAPTCTEIGLTEGKHCSVCEEILLAQEELPATGHDFVIGVCRNCGLELKNDYDLFSGKTMNLKLVNSETGKNYTAKELSWELVEGCEPFASVTKAGRLTAKKVFEKVRVEAIGTVAATQQRFSVLVDIYPAVTQVEVRSREELVNGKTLLMDVAGESLTLTAAVFPEDTLPEVSWTVSDAARKLYADYTMDGHTLTVSNPTGKTGTVTIKAVVKAGIQKTVTVKVQFGRYARKVEIATPQTTTVRGGGVLDLTAAITEPEKVTKPGIVWSVSDKTAATISGGRLRAKTVAHPVTVTVTAASKDGQASDTIDIRILPKEEGKLVLAENGRLVTGTTRKCNAEDVFRLSAFTVENGELVGQEVTWKSSRNAVAAVSEDGTVTCGTAGTARITATAGGATASVTVSVGVLAQSLTLSTRDGKNLTQEEGETLAVVASGKSVTLAAAISPARASKTVTWEVIRGDQYAKILSTGKLTATKDLTDIQYATVRATAKDGSGKSAEIRVKIMPLATGVQIYESGNRVRSNTVYVCDMLAKPVLKLSARVYPAKANQAVELTSSNKSVAKFNEEGDLVCLKPGTVTITAKALDGSNQKTTFKLTVVKKITDLTLKEGSSLTVVGGRSLKLAPMVQISPSDATNKKLTWKVSDNDFGIKISTSGVLTTRKVKESVTVNIMVTTQDDSGKMLSFDVTVNPA